jgi:hypothetical protein
METQFNNCTLGQEKALELAREVTESRLSALNEWRETYGDLLATYITRHEYALQVEKYDLEVRGLRESRAELAGKASQRSVNLAIAFTACSLVLAVIAILIPLLK